MLSHPHPQSELFPKKLPLLPHPPQKKSKKIIQMKELLHPHPLLELEEEPHPHPVAVKSLIIFASKRFLFMVYHMWHGLYVFPFLEKNYCTICGQNT